MQIGIEWIHVLTWVHAVHEARKPGLPLSGRSSFAKGTLQVSLAVIIIILISFEGAQNVI